MDKYKTINLKRFNKFIIILIFFTWLLAIFNFSAMSGKESNAKSKQIITKDLSVGTRIISKVDKDNKVTKINKPQAVNKLNVILRKCMHGTVYFILCLIIIAMLKNFGIQNKKAYIIAIICCFIYACTDEFHQLYVEGRSASFIDVIIDTTGAVLGACLWMVISKFIRSRA